MAKKGDVSREGKFFLNHISDLNFYLLLNDGG
jgi:hypothetical protein